MKVVFDSYGPGEEIPVREYLKKRKLKKYFNRETEAAIVAVGKLTAEMRFDPETPFYYAAGLIEYEDYGLLKIIRKSIDEEGKFSPQRLIEEGMPLMSPFSQFKVLQNMPLSFIAVEHQLTGDNAVIYTSASGLLLLGLHSVFNGPVLLGAGKTYQDGKVDVGFAYVTKEEIEDSSFKTGSEEAVDMFRAWASGGHPS